MNLGTVGAVLAFAIRLEDHTEHLYLEAASLVVDSEAEAVLLSLAEAKRKRSRLVQRSRREFVNEMLLEPILGLDGSDDLLERKLSSGLDSRGVLQLARELEEGSQQQYLDVAASIGHLPQLARVFSRLSQGNADHISRLESLRGEKGCSRL